MVKGKIFRKSMGAQNPEIYDTTHTPRPNEPAIALNRDGSVQRKKDPARERIKKMKAEFRRAMEMMDEALEIMDNIEEAFLDLEKTNFQDP